MPIALKLVLLYIIFNISLFVFFERICALLSTKTALRIYKRCWLVVVSSFGALIRAEK